MNQAILQGNLGRNAEVRYTPSGKAVVNFTMATSEKRGNEWVPTWHNVVAFGEQHEQLASQLTKGTKVNVKGKISYNQWTDKNGNKREKTEIVGFEITIVPKKDEAFNEPQTSSDDVFL